MDDNAFLYVFKPIISKIMEIFDPGAVVLQCGADSLTGDRLGTFNVTLKGEYINKKKEKGKDFGFLFLMFLMFVSNFFLTFFYFLLNIFC